MICQSGPIHINMKARKSLLLQSHQASQQTNFGRVRDQPEFPVPDARLIWKILDVCTCISPHLPRFQVIEIEALPIPKNFYHQGTSSGVDVEEKILFRVESHVFSGEEFESKWRLYKFLWLKPICFSEYLKHILELWNALKPFTRASAQKQSRHNKSFGGRQSSQSHAWMTPRASKSTCKQIISARVCLGATDWTRLTHLKNHIMWLWVIGFIKFV